MRIFLTALSSDQSFALTSQKTNPLASDHAWLSVCDCMTYLSLDIFLVILVVVCLHAQAQFLDELLLGVFVYTRPK